MRSFISILLLVFTLLLMSIISFAQNTFTDVIYPIHGNDSISKCHILKIKKGNLIIYQQNNKQDTVEAIAVVKKGRFIDFRTRKELKNDAYPILNPSTTNEEIVKGAEYYEIQYRNALHQKRTGAAFSVLGAICSITSFYMIYTGNNIQGIFTPALFCTFISLMALFGSTASSSGLSWWQPVVFSFLPMCFFYLGFVMHAMIKKIINLQSVVADLQNSANA